MWDTIESLMTVVTLLIIAGYPTYKLFQRRSRRQKRLREMDAELKRHTRR